MNLQMSLKHKNISVSTVAFLKACSFPHRANVYRWGCRLSTKPHSQVVLWLFSRCPRASDGTNAIH